MSLAILPPAFGLNVESVKGCFPHFFNALENMTYKGAYPAEEFYVVEVVSSEKKSKFQRWYRGIAK